MFVVFIGLCALSPTHASPADDSGVAGLVFANLSSELRVLRVARVEEHAEQTFLAGAYDNGVWGRQGLHYWHAGEPFSRRAVTDFELWALDLAWSRLLRAARVHRCALSGPRPELTQQGGDNLRLLPTDVRVFWNAGVFIRSDCQTGPDAHGFARAFDTLEAVLSLIAPEREVALPKSIAFERGRLRVVIRMNHSEEDTAPVGMILPSVRSWETAVLAPSDESPPLHVLDELEQSLLANLLADVPSDSTESSHDSCCYRQVFPTFEIDQLSTGPGCGTDDYNYLAWVHGMESLFLQVAVRALRDSAASKGSF